MKRNATEPTEDPKKLRSIINKSDKLYLLGQMFWNSKAQGTHSVGKRQEKIGIKLRKLENKKSLKLAKLAGKVL